MSYLRKLLLFVWKNIVTQRRLYYILLIEIILSICIILFVYALHYPFHVRSPVRQIVYDSYNLSKVPILNGKALVYLPRNPIFRKIVEIAASNLNMSYYGVNTISNVELSLLEGHNNVPVAAGIILEESYKNMKVIPPTFSYILAFPSSLRNSPSGSKKLFWQTVKYDYAGKESPRNSDDDIYISEGFVSIQHAIFEAYFELALNKYNENTKKFFLYKNTKLSLNAFPKFIGKRRNLHDYIGEFLEFLYNVQYLIFSLHAVWLIARERQVDLRIYIQIFDIPFWIHWLSHFIVIFCNFTILNVLGTVLFRVAFNTDGVFHTQKELVYLFLFLTLYSIDVILLSFIVIAIVTKPKTAVLLMVTLWISCYSTFSYLVEIAENITYIIMICFLYVNNILTYTIPKLYVYNTYDEKVRWFTIHTINGEFNFFFPSLMLIVDAVVYSLILYYIYKMYPSVYVQGEPWTFPCKAITHIFCKPKPQPVYALPDVPLEDIEKLTNFKKTAIRLNKLQYIRHGRLVISNLTLNIYEGEITTFYGHNGSGKTSALFMIGGIIEPDSGSAYLFNENIHLSQMARMNIAICPADNKLLIEEFTVYEHLRFLCKLKNLPMANINEEISTYLKLLNNESITNIQSKYLSYDDKRLLCLVIALCGNTKVLILDEPTQYMTAEKRRQFWDILQSEKLNRVIILSTHCNEEASFVSDRIVFMSKGSVKCYGSQMFIKKRYGGGYNLHLVKGENFNLNNVISAINNILPGIRPENDNGNEIYFKIPIVELTHPITNLMVVLEKRQAELGIYSMGVLAPSIHDAYMNIGMDTNNQKLYDKNASRIYEISMLPPNKRIRSQINGILYKKLIFQSPNFFPVILVIFGVVLIVFLQKVSLVTIGKMTLKVPMSIESEQFKYSTVYVHSSLPHSNDSKPSNTKQLHSDYLKNISSKAKVIQLSDVNITSYFLEKNKNPTLGDAQIGASFYDNEIILWFNPVVIGSSAFSLNVLHNLILKDAISKNYEIKLINYPMTETFVDELTITKETAGHMVLAISICVSVPIMTSSFIIFIITEKRTYFKDLQFLAGLNNWIFWTFGWLWDYMTNIFFNILFCYCMLIATFQDFNKSQKLAMVCFSFPALCLVYLLSTRFRNVQNGIICAVLFSVLFGASSYSLSEEYGWGFSPIFVLLSYISPYYILALTIENIHDVERIERICLNKALYLKKSMKEICFMPESAICCKNQYFQWKHPGILRYLLTFFVTGVIAFITMIAKDYVIDYFKYNRLSVKDLYPFCGKDINKEALEEKQKICKLNSEQLCSYRFVVDQLEGPIEKNKAFRTISFTLRSSKAVAILGAKKTNKSELSKKMAGLMGFSYGDIYINGVNYKSCYKDVFRKIGYCFQKHGHMLMCSSLEYLRILCLIRCVEKSNIEPFLHELVDSLALQSFKHHKIYRLTQGQCRRLNVACSLIAAVEILIIDEPTADIDVTSRQQIFNFLRYVRFNGKSIVCFTSDADEAGILADKVILYVGHSMFGYGSAEMLRKSHSKGICADFKLYSRGMYANEIAENYTNDIHNLKAFIREISPNAVQLSGHRVQARFFLPLKDIVWSKLFFFLDSGMERLHIKEYLIGEIPLQDILLRLSENINMIHYRTR